MVNHLLMCMWYCWLWWPYRCLLTLIFSGLCHYEFTLLMTNKNTAQSLINRFLNLRYCGCNGHGDGFFVLIPCDRIIISALVLMARLLFEAELPKSVRIILSRYVNPSIAPMTSLSNHHHRHVDRGSVLWLKLIQKDQSWCPVWHQFEPRQSW